MQQLFEPRPRAFEQAPPAHTIPRALEPPLLASDKHGAPVERKRNRIERSHMPASRDLVPVAAVNAVIQLRLQLRTSALRLSSNERNRS